MSENNTKMTPGEAYDLEHDRMSKLGHLEPTAHQFGLRAAIVRYIANEGLEERAQAALTGKQGEKTQPANAEGSSS